VTETRDQRLARASEALEQAHARLDHWAGPCNECKFFRSRFFGLNGQNARQRHEPKPYDKCHNALVMAQELDNVAGFQPVDCGDARSRRGVCGPDGELFEEYVPEQAKSFWALLFG
jgi:hypothetical protein